MTMTTNKDALRIKANRNITSILDKLGVTYNDRGNLIQATCPCKQHGGDGNNTSAFSWRHDIGYWVCWTHHCQDSYGNDIFGLVRSVLGLDFIGAVKWISDAMDNKVDIVTLTEPAPRRRPSGGCPG